jgi:hypothetical protein
MLPTERTNWNIPYGYDYINGKQVENKRESLQVKKIYEMYLSESTSNHSDEDFT